MARTNTALKRQAFTHEGAKADPNLTAEQQLRRSVMSCLLWEDQFYEDGVAIADRIKQAAEKVDLNKLADIAIEARSVHNLRHAPLWLLLTLIERGRGQHGVQDVIAQVIQRADEMTELLALYWKDKPDKPIAAQLRKGLKRAFANFDEYQLAKYDRDAKIKLRDVLRLTRPKPADAARSALYKGVKDRTLAAPDTWEVALSGGADKKATFERLLSERKLGYLALLRNLRNMAQAGVDADLVKDALLARKGAYRVLPFRYVAAARAAPQYEPWIDQALVEAIGEMPVLDGKTIVLVDVSGSMDYPLSSKSDLKRLDAAAALASIVPGDVRVFTFSDQVVEVPPRRGMAGVDAVKNSQEHGGTYLGQAISHMNRLKHDRLIVITDEQSHDEVGDPVAERAYLINVASYQNGVGYGKYVHLDGFSEGVLKFIREYEQNDRQ